jgi:UDP-3-O-[3-hydroxymyristoyl] glucosamine N-acyltransferase
MAGCSVSDLIVAARGASGGKLEATLIGSDRAIEAAAPLDTAGATHLSFLANARYRNAAAASSAGALVLSDADRRAVFPDGAPAKALIVCGQPYAWFAFAARQLAPRESVVPLRSARAEIHSNAQVAGDARVDAFAVIEQGAQIGNAAWIGAGCYVGRGAQIGARTRLHPGARVLAECVVGSDCELHSGCTVGADGFGFAPFDGRYVKIPQTGRALVGNDVEIGANTTIDRGTMGDTAIEDGVKIDNQVQIGHNCRIGAHTVIAGCVGIAGSANIGRGCQLGGAAMILGHLSIADGTVVSSGTLVSRSIAEAGFYTGFFPLMSNRDWERNAAVLRQLDELRKRVRELERRQQEHDKDSDAAPT